jgi:uncharacterized RmlC-like cupin family protein
MAAVEFIDIAPEVKEDVRGTSFFPWRDRVRRADEWLRTFHLISIRPGKVRGNHLHPGHEEWLYLFHGVGVFVWAAAEGEAQERAMTGGRTLIRIAPGVAHAMRNEGKEELYLLAWREALREDYQGPETLPRSLSGGDR